MHDRARWNMGWNGTLLLLTALVWGCSSEQGTPDAGGGPAVPVSAIAAADRTLPDEKPGEARRTAAAEGADGTQEEAGGHGPDENAAPHGHDEDAGPVVALTATERANIGLKTEPARIEPFQDLRRLPGVLKAAPDRIALVTSRTPGKVVRIHAALGQNVSRGKDLIDVQSVEVDALETELQQAENRLRLAQAEEERARPLVEKGIMARKELVAAENQLQSVNNEIEGLVRRLRLLGVSPEEIARARRDRGDTILHIPSPISGIVVERGAVVGQEIEPADMLMKVVDVSVLIAEGAAPEPLLRELRVGQPVRVTVAAFPDRSFEGRLTFIHPQIDPERRVARVWAEVRNPEGQLKEDMFAQMSVAVGEGSKALVIPAAALISDGALEFVFVESPAGFVRRDVVVGARNDRYVEVKQGIRPGAPVVTDGKRQVYTLFLAARSGAPALEGHQH